MSSSVEDGRARPQAVCSAGSVGPTPSSTLRFAYADPPYPGQAARWYKDQASYAGEVDHVELIGLLKSRYPDGWALSTSAAALRLILALSPSTARVAVWYRTNSEPPGNRGRWHWSWEPVIVVGGRQKYGEAPSVRDVLNVPGLSSEAAIPGQKPPAFCRWVANLLGYQEGDEIVDLFPGSGIVGRSLEQGSLAL
ncbi:MAG TPA: hypothetical protein VLL25_17425 [Acidimicrobiales bacterium]|nr:hypothetical protein [Acidimicrobiales bacterium]